MRKLIAPVLVFAVLAGTCSCAVPEGPRETTTVSEITSEENTTETSAPSVSDETSASSEAAYVDSGFLKGLRIEKDNCFVSENEKYQDLINWTMKKAVSRNFKGTLIIGTDDEVLLYQAPNNSLNVDGDPVDPYTTYEIGSVTKMFTAVEILKLAEQGRIKTDDKLTDYFPEFKAGKDITIDDLLRMRSGIPDYVNEPASFWGDKMKAGFKITDDALSDDDFLDALYKIKKLAFKPGTKCEYSNTNYHLLAMIIEKIEGIGYGEVISRDIFIPCSMDHSSAVTDGDVTSVPDKEVGYHEYQKGARGAGDIHSCAKDMLAFDRALFGGTLISPESMEFMKKDSSESEYGCGLMNQEDFVFGHNGATNSYITQNAVIETKEYGNVYFFASTSTALGVEGLFEAFQMAINWAK